MSQLIAYSKGIFNFVRWTATIRLAYYREGCYAHSVKPPPSIMKRRPPMLSILTSIVGIAAIGGYFYVAIMFGRASRNYGNGWIQVAFDATTWPVAGWAAIEKLYRA